MKNTWFSRAAVERGAQALHGEDGEAWEALTDTEKEQRRATVREVLAAVTRPAHG